MLRLITRRDLRLKHLTRPRISEEVRCDSRPQAHNQ